jgi:SAM-dependent methyltransferase
MAKPLRAKDAARALPDDLNQTLRGFMESRAILTALELDVFTALEAGATAEEVARKIATHPRSTEMFLNALASMGLLTKQNGVFHNTPVSGRFFAAGSKDNARLGLLHIVNLWPRWSTLTDCVRSGTRVSVPDAVAREDNWTEPFIAAMHYYASERAPLVVAAVDAQRIERMLDVGGGSAAYSIAFAKANPKLHATVLDLPSVLPIAERHIRDANLEARIETRPGDLRRDRFGTGFDLVLVSAICHMLGPEENQDLLRRCYEALAIGGKLVIQDFILEPDKTAPKHAALFALNMLVGTESGSTYSHEEYSTWMREAGFHEVRHIRLPGPSSLITGERR